MNKLQTQETLVEELKIIISSSKNQAIQNVNSILTLMYWKIGSKINNQILNNQRADYGRTIVATVSRQLKIEFGKGFEEKNLRRMIQFSQLFTEEKVVTLLRELSWSHFLVVLPLKDELQRDFYLQMCRNERWSVRVLRDRIDSMLYERTALSKKPDELISYELEKLKSDTLTPNLILKDPYILDFLELNDRYLEKDLEDAILRDIEKFMLELGSGFTFIARQKVLQIDNDDFKIDLLFYNRKLKRLIAIDLKIGRFKAEYKGQMELYLKWLEKYEKEEDENSPIGIILCADKKSEQIELLELEKSNIHVAQYLTVLPPMEVLQNRLHQAVAYARIKYKLSAKQDED